MRNRSASINFLNSLLLTAAIGLLIYWAARPLRGQAMYNGRTLTGAMTPPRHSRRARGSIVAPLLDTAMPQAASQTLQAMPLAFVENRGQADAHAAFLVQGRDTSVWFTAQGLTLAFTQRADEKSPLAKTNARKRWNLKLDFIGANPAAFPSGKDLATARMSYFSGAQEAWRTGIRSYASIVYADLWPGIDLIYSGTTNRLKYEFIVKPGADPQQIRLAYRGASAPLAVIGQGQLEIPTPFGVIHDDKPTSSQANGKQVKTEFVIHERVADGSQQYGFKLGKYDKRKMLVIDPAILVYSGFIGGSGDDEGHSIAVDGNGYAYVTGVTASAEATFPETAGPDLSYNGQTDAFVAKIKTDGSGLVYAGYIGGDGDDAGHSIAVDTSGNAYVTGWTTSTQATFPVLGTLGQTFNGAVDAFVAKVNPAGTALSYCGYIGGDDEDVGLGIAVDSAGRAYVTGLTASTEATFPKLVGPGLLFKGGIDAFVARVKADGSGLDYAGYLGGSGDDQGRSIAVDTGGNAYVTGLTASTEASFPMVGTLGSSFKGGTDAFVARINSTGSAISYSGFIGGSGIDEAYGIAVDGSGAAYITGRTTSTEATFPKLVGPDLTFNGGVDAFVAKINAAGSALSYAGYVGGSGDDEGFSIAVDGAGDAVVTGRTSSSEATFPKANAFDLTLNGGSDGFIAKVNPAGSALAFAGYLGGNGLEEGFGTAINGLRQIYVTGRSASADNSFPGLVGPGLSFGGASDAFVMRIDDNSVVCPPLAINPALLPNGAAGISYNQSLTGAGGAAPYSFTIIGGALPPNLSLSLTGAISGTAIQDGNFSFTVMVTDTSGCTGTQAYAVTINPPNSPPTIVAGTPLTRQQGSAEFVSAVATVSDAETAAGSLAVAATTVPAGITVTNIINTDGTITATVAASCTAVVGSSLIVLTVTDNAGATATASLTITVTANTTPGLIYANQSVTAGGSLSVLPVTATDNGSIASYIVQSQGTFSGTVSVNSSGVVLLANAGPSGTHTITVRATDNCGEAANATFNVTVGCQTITVITPGTSAGTVNAAFSATFTQTGGIGALTFTTASTLPTGITLLSSGVLSGTPTQTGSFPITVKATDANGCMGTSATYLLTINCQTISVGPFSIASGNPGVGYSQQFTQTGGVGTITFSTASALPTGVTFSSSGLLSGTTNQTGSFPITIKVTDANNCMGLASYTLAFGCPVITVTLPVVTTGTAGLPFSQTFTQSGSPAGATFSTGNTLPNGLTLSSTGVLSGIPTQTGTFPMTVTATGSGGCTGMSNYTLTIGCPAITLSSLTGGTAGTAYNQVLAASPSGGGYSFAVTTGSLPQGLSLNGSTGAISGTPAVAGTFNFAVTASGFGNCTGSQAYSVVINCPAITLSPASLPNATVNTPYSQMVSSTPPGTTYSFSIANGALPIGLSLNASTGAITGLPAQDGTFNFRIAATGWGNCTGFRDYTLTINCPAITVNPATLPGGAVGTAYNQTVSATPSGAYSFSIASGALPSGLMLNGSTGAITGTPTTIGSFTFTIMATAGSCTNSRSFTIAIACQTISFATIALPAGNAGIVYSQTLSVTPVGSYTFSLTQGNLPLGLTLNSSTGLISGLPSVTGTYNFTVKAQAANNCSATQVYSLTINCPVVAVAPASVPNGTKGTVYSQTFSVTPAGGNYTFAVSSGSAPSGLTLNPATGSLSGVPSADGTFSFTITATGFGACAGSQSYTVVIGSSCPNITLTDLPNGNVGQLYSNLVEASPSGSYTYVITAGSLPAGLTLFGSVGLVYGYPTVNGTFTFTITATSSSNCAASKSYTIVIGGAALQLPVINDFTGDHRSDFVLWRAAQRRWLIVDSATGVAQTSQWGQAGDLAVPGDYDGDGKADLASFGKDGHWRIRLSLSDATLNKAWGAGTDVPVPGDYDGDGKTDLAIWRGAETTWYILRSSDGQTQTMRLGASYAPYFDVPVPGDYDGDGKTDVGVFRPSTGHWYIKRSSDGIVIDNSWGLGTDVPVPGDYDGDGKTDIAVWRGVEGAWYIIKSSDDVVEVKTLGATYASNIDVPVPGDYDGDGKADIAIWRKSEGRWYIARSSDGTIRVITQGGVSDNPVTATSHR